MTKEEAIEYFESQKKELEYFREMYPSPEDEGYKDTTKEIGFVDMAISALKDGWIPVTERLPEEGKNVLFCDIDNDIMLGYHLTYAPATHFIERGAWEDVKNVRAWMELPEVYKERGE